MGNSLPLPCVCHCWCHEEVNDVEAGTAAVAGGTKKRKRKQQQQQQRPDRSRNVWAAQPRHVVVPVVDEDDTPENGHGLQEQEAWPECCRVEPAGHGEDGAVRVRIVMKRRDIAQLVARLEQRGAGGIGIEEVVGTELAGCNSGNADGGGVTMMSPCRDPSWRPRLSIIPEN